MATKILKGINFPGLKDTYIIPEAAIELDSTLTETGKAADAAAVGERFDSLDTVVAVDENSDGNIEIRSYLPEQDYLQLDKSLTVEGAAAEGAATGIAISKSSSPHNYLDNSDFRNPVNQRGEASYQFDSGYTIDRWKMHWSGDGTLTINDGYITLYRAEYQAYLIQNIPTEARLFGKTVTLAAKVRGKGHIGRIFESTDVRDAVYFTSSEWMIALYTFVVPTYSFDTHVFNGIEIRNSGDESIDVEWIALYEGEYTEETLPDYKPKGYSAELAECQRYYVAYDFYESFSLGKTYSSDGTKADIQFSTSSNLRLENPTIVNELSLCMAVIDGINYPGTLLSATVSGNTVSMIFQSSESMPLHTMCMLRMIGKFALSADL